MKSDAKQTWAVCPKCQSEDTTKNGTAPSKEGRVQRLRCNKCKHIWNDPTFPRKPLSVARASKPRTVGSIASTRSTGHLSTTPALKSSNSPELKTLQPPMAHHRKLELDIPLDWSPMGLLNFARAAQHNLLVLPHFQMVLCVTRRLSKWLTILRLSLRLARRIHSLKVLVIRVVMMRPN